MKGGWAVVWTGKTCSVFLKRNLEWTLDPDEAHVFDMWVFAAAACLGTEGRVVRAWH